MTKLWVDPPSGWMFGFPKVWDSEEYPDLSQWLYDNGYRYPEAASYVRIWEYKENNAEANGT